LELRKRNLLLNKNQKTLKEKNKELEKFAYVVAHDIKSPLNQIISLSGLLESEYAAQLGKEANQLIAYVKDSSGKLKDLVDGILSYYQGENILKEKKEELDFSQFLEEIISLLDPKKEFQFHYPKDKLLIKVNKVALGQIFINLIGNSIKYNDKDKGEITIFFDQDSAFYFFTIVDNGPGIAEEDKERIFNVFTNLGKKDRYNNLGTGIGLATVKKLVGILGGKIEVLSEINKGSTFKFSLKK
ncbi:sensor histidine kinase, partial [Xanthovirga aplysinae]|uniref:sensor histidine kinase n=1 Tax=Xanthovirga aplysinae TaxID=2529853 RepID=UPI0016572B66